MQLFEALVLAHSSSNVLNRLLTSAAAAVRRNIQNKWDGYFDVLVNFGSAAGQLGKEDHPGQRFLCLPGKKIDPAFLPQNVKTSRTFLSVVVERQQKNF